MKTLAGWLRRAADRLDPPAAPSTDVGRAIVAQIRAYERRYGKGWAR